MKKKEEEEVKSTDHARVTAQMSPGFLYTELNPTMYSRILGWTMRGIRRSSRNIKLRFLMANSYS